MLFFFLLFQPQLFGNGCEQTAVETQQGEKDILTYAAGQYGFNTVLMLRNAFSSYRRAGKIQQQMLFGFKRFEEIPVKGSHSRPVAGHELIQLFWKVLPCLFLNILLHNKCILKCKKWSIIPHTVSYADKESFLFTVFAAELQIVVGQIEFSGHWHDVMRVHLSTRNKRTEKRLNAVKYRGDPNQGSPAHKAGEASEQVSDCGDT